ncbi:ABC transporter substrate-binding protein [Bradyrhizobium sp. LHD-71]|uniref:ABC transporter substrate-binding protein n=1 Tax=Bradyrhizobium sp. LHD-71 TaxID=3072141 RepID=UPI00280DB79D|nr:ABC transporter substrate-binding protein [Bradyrhizobium sp. LHD-71]MDQ8728183.1 ABC transporter substrate-binding protein [Bradyrhizobium sp. LHD-71]
MITRRHAALLLGAPLILPARAFAQERQPATPRRGGELLFGLDGAAVASFVLDPHDSGFAPHNRVFRSIYDGLVVLRPDQSVGPWLATSWEISPDQKNYTFKLRTDVIFHDGTKFDAAAVKANLDRIGNGEGRPLTALPDIGSYESTEVLAPDTVRIRLKEPFAPLLRNLSKTTLGIISPAALAKHGAAIAQNPVGSGPFRFVSLVQGVEIKLERNPDYNWAPAGAAHQGPAYLERLTFKNVPEEATRVAAVQSRQVHAADGIPPQNVVAFRSASGFQMLEKELLNNNYTIYLNVTKAPWNDEEIRQAFRASLDLDAAVRVIYLGTTPRAWAPLSPSIFASADASLKGSWRPDLARAQQILEAKGWKVGARGIREKNGERLTVSFADTQGNREKRLDVIQFLRRQLARSGFDLSIDSQPNATYRQKLTDGDYDLSGASQFAPDPDVLSRLHLPDGRTRASVAKTNDPDISEWLRAGRREGDPEKRAEYYVRAQRKLVEKVYAIPIYVLLYTIAASDQLQGLVIDTHGFPQFHGAWLRA